jgi:hypothetical protein
MTVIGVVEAAERDQLVAHMDELSGEMTRLTSLRSRLLRRSAGFARFGKGTS